MEKKIGCYICTGCGIGEALDTVMLGKIASKEQKIPVVKNHEFLCGAEGLALIKADMANDGVNAVIVAACSPRVHTETFLSLNAPLLDRVNLREQVIWVQPVEEGDEEGEEDRQMMAEDYLRMGCVKVKKMNVPEPFSDPGMSKRILVVGGGPAGMTAALEAANTGYEVVLVEKEEELGGMMKIMHKQSPSKAPYRDLQPNNVADMAAAVKDNGKITLYTGCTIDETAGAPGLFDIKISNGQSERVGAIIVSTGYTPYDVNKLTHLGHGASPDVIGAVEFEQMAKAGKIVRKSDGSPAKRVGFVLCAGSRDPNHLEYCSGACCTYSMKQALYVKEQYADEAMTYLIYQEIRTPGQMEDFYRKAQDEGVVFIKGDVKSVSNGSGRVKVTVADKLVRSDETLEVDLLVLATGMVPNIDAKPSDTIIPIVAAGEDPKDAAAEEGGASPAQVKSVLNLKYRQGPALPELKWGFPDSHYICFPYETRRTGIYTCGPVRRPMGIAAARDDATGAALKAIQAVESVARGAAVHPRAGDLSYPSFREEGCTQCKRCTEECPFGAINEDEKGNPRFQPTRCRRCGTCMGACPQKIISFANYSVDMIGSMLKEVDVPEEDDEKPRVLLFCCENDAYPALDMVGFAREKLNTYIRVIPLRCMGSMNLVWIADAMSSGFDGILLMGCRHGEDYQCHFVRGSALAEVRLSKVSETLDRLQLESERVKMMEVNIMDVTTLPKQIEAFVEHVTELGPNPYKGF